MTKPDYKDSPIAIIGLGGNFPDASHVEQFWKNICNGHVAIGDVPAERWDTDLYYNSDRQAPDRTYSKIGAFVKDVRFDRKSFASHLARLNTLTLFRSCVDRSR